MAKTEVKFKAANELVGRQVIAMAGLMKSVDPAVSNLTGSAGKLFASSLAMGLVDNTVDGQTNGQPIPSSGSVTGSLPASDWPKRGQPVF